jgi:hypothetical protein
VDLHGSGVIQLAQGATCPIFFITILTPTIISMELLRVIIQTVVGWVRELIVDVSGRWAEEIIVKRGKLRGRKRKRRCKAKDLR